MFDDEFNYDESRAIARCSECGELIYDDSNEIYMDCKGNYFTCLRFSSFALKNTKDVMTYIEKVLNGDDINEKLKQLESEDIIKINKLNEDNINYDSIVIAGGNNGKLGKEQYENIDKVLIETLKDKEKNIVAVEQSSTKFSYIDLYSKDKITTIDNIDEGTGKLSLVIALQDKTVSGKFGKLKGSDSIIPYKK